MNLFSLRRQGVFFITSQIWLACAVALTITNPLHAHLPLGPAIVFLIIWMTDEATIWEH